jgi:carbon-monoxide dehydrogenase iron sulfur subunit
MKKMLVVDYEKCMSCHSCELACAVAHSEGKELTKAIGEKSKPVSRIFVEQILGKSVPMQCRHCEDAPCIAVCPSHAMNRASDESPVLLDKETCIGCNACIVVCPFGIITKSSDGKVITKCDLCIDRLQEGSEPACVVACPTKAIRYETVARMTGGRRKEKYSVIIEKGVA